MSVFLDSGYDPVKASPAFRALVEGAVKDQGDVRRAMKLRAPKIAYVRDLGDHLARWLDGTNLAIVLSERAHVSAVRRTRGLEIRDLVESSLLHEYAHAFMASRGYVADGLDPDDEERIAENFAHYVWKTADHSGGISDLDAACQRLLIGP